MKGLKFKFECPDCGSVEYVTDPISVRKECPDPGCIKYLFCWNDAETACLPLMREALLDDLRLNWIKDSKPKRELSEGDRETIALKKGHDLITLEYSPSKENITVKFNGERQIIYPVKIEDRKINVYRHGVMRANSTVVY